MFLYIISAYFVIGLICLTVCIRKNNSLKDFKIKFDFLENTNLLFRILNFFIGVLVCIFAFFLALLIAPFMVFTLKSKKETKKETKKSPTSLQQVEKFSIPAYPFNIKHQENYIPNIKQIIYIETFYNPDINAFFEKYYNESRTLFKTKLDFEFIYLPRTIQEIDLEELVRYNRPNLSFNDSLFKNTIIESVQKYYIEALYKNEIPLATQDILKSPNNTQGFIHFKNTKYNDNTNFTEDNYTFFPLLYENEDQFFEVINYYIRHSGLPTVKFRKTPIPKIPPEYDEEVKELTKEIKERIERLQCIGLNNMIINKLILPEIKPSKLRITKDYRIFLVDYNNTEIEMPTLSKTLFFFYLRHTAGMPFKQLIDHKDELLQIYKRVTNRDDIDALGKSIEYLVSPLHNSINEK